MKSLLKKVRGDKKGFTLAELLVVVAIVGILVAISVPVFTAQLGKARQATNNANLRAAKAAAVANYLTADENFGGKVEYEYNVDAGTITSDNVTVTGPQTEVNDPGVSKVEVYKTIYVTIEGDSDVKKQGEDVSVTLNVVETKAGGTTDLSKKE